MDTFLLGLIAALLGYLCVVVSLPPRRGGMSRQPPLSRPAPTAHEDETAAMGMVEIIDPAGNLVSRCHPGHPTAEWARRTEGYSVRTREEA